MNVLTEHFVLVALTLVGVGAAIMARDFSDGTAHGGHLVPQLAGGLMAALALCALLRSRGQIPVEKRGDTWRPVAVLATTIAMLWLMPIVGYPLVTPLWVASTMVILGARQPLIIGGVSVGLSTIAYLLLAGVAFAPPPMGVFGAR